MKIALALLLATAVAACASGTTDPREPPAMTLSDGRPAVVLTANTDAWPHDQYQFAEAHLAGDTLVVRVTHGGGCRTHEFALLVNPAFLESWPVQMHGTLAHDAKGDPCRALLSPTLRFDLTPLRDAYRQSYQTSSGAISLRIQHWPSAIEYRF